VTDYEEQESIEYEQDARYDAARARRRHDILNAIGRLALTLLETASILILTTVGWSLILGALGVSIEGWAFRNWLHLSLGTLIVVVAATRMYRR